MIEKLREINNRLLKLNQNKESAKKYQLIERILKDDRCFFKMQIEDAYAILRDLEIPEEDIERLYLKLIASKNF